MVAPARPAGSGGEWTENIDVWWKNIQRELKRPRDDIKPPQWLSDIKAVLNKEEENGCGCAAQRKQKVDEEGPSMVQRQLTPPASASTRPSPSTPVQRLQRIDCKLPANVTPGAVITVHTPAGDPVRLKVPQGATPGAFVEFSIPAFPPRLYARATGEAGTFGLTVPEGLVGGSPIRAMTPDGLEVNMALPNEATPGRPITFKIKTDGPQSTDRLPCVPAMATGVDGHYEATVPSALLTAGATSLKVLLPNQALAVVPLPPGASEGTKLAFVVSPRS